MRNIDMKIPNLYMKAVALGAACPPVWREKPLVTSQWRQLGRVYSNKTFWFYVNVNWCLVKLESNDFAYFSQLFINLTSSGVPHLYKQLLNGQYLSDLCKMCNLEANLWKMWTGDHRFLTYIFKWERLNTAGHSHPVSIGHWMATLYND